MKPTVGRIVHYHRNGEGPLAATVVAVLDADRVRLRVLPADGGLGFAVEADRADAPTIGCWNWPPRED